MANRKITAMTAHTAPATDDVLPIVDVSEVAAADKNKKITVQELFKGAPSGTESAPGIAFEADDGNGIYLAGTDTVAISTGGTQRLSINASGDVTIPGSLTVDGTTTTINSATLTVDDKNIELGSVASPSNTTADGGGITLKGATDKEIKWVNSTGYWTFNTGIEVGGHLQIDDDNEIRVGTAADLVIRHNGTDTIFENDTGHVYVSNYADDKDIILRTDNGSGGISNYVVCDGSAGKVRLYSLGVERLQTGANGILVTGEVECDSLDVNGAADITGNVVLHGNLDLQDDDVILLGTGDDLQIEHDGTNSFINNYTAALVLRNYSNDADILLSTDNGSGGTADYIRCDGSTGEVKLYHYGSTKLQTTADGVDITSTGALRLPVGTTAQRPSSPATGDIRFSSTDSAAEIYNGTGWGAIGGGGATGGGSDQWAVEHDNTITTSYTISSGKNVISAGPLTVNSGAVVTVPSGSNWVIV